MLPSLGVLAFFAARGAVLARLGVRRASVLSAAPRIRLPSASYPDGTDATPLLVALAGKAKVVTLVTGLGHEKLNVVHRWVGWSVFGLSVAHTIPFIVAPLPDGGYSALHKQFYKPGTFEVE